MNEQAYQWLKPWFLERYEDPVESCPYESADGVDVLCQDHAAPMHGYVIDSAGAQHG
jgi:hypothetical protein